MPRRPSIRCLAALCIAALALAAAVPDAGALDRGGKVTPEDVKRALDRGRQALMRNLIAYRGQNEPGYRVLCLMALLNSGVKPNDPSVVDEIADVARRAELMVTDNYQGVYRAGLLLSLFSMTKDNKYKTVATTVARCLMRHQSPNGGWGDNSRTQFALLGLKSAEDMGVDVPDSVYTSARKHIEAGQAPDGGWGYTAAQATSYGSMTAAGISSMFITGGRLYRGTKECGQGASDRRLVKGLEWMARNFSVRSNPGTGGMGHHYYYLYGLERIGVLMAQKTIGGHDWYREGAEYLVRAQSDDGTWREDWAGTEFAMLFLGKGSAPVAIQKLRYGQDWNPDPYDAKELTEFAARDMDTPMTWQVTDTDASAEELAAAPILYLQGHRSFTFDDAFRKRLRLFIDNGGFVMISNCCGSADFDEAVRKEFKVIFPDSAFDPLPNDHLIYTLRHRIVAPQAFMIEGLNTGCRTSVFYAPNDICCAWGGCDGCKDPKCVRGPEQARKLGVNLIALAIGANKLKDKLEEIDLLVKPTEAKIERGALVIGQLFHQGEWDPDPASIPNLTKTLREQTGMRGNVAKRRVVLGTDDPGDYPMLYITGHKKFEYTDEQVKALRAYLDKGGFLFADPCCGKADFDIAFRKLCAKLYPDQDLERLARTHPVLDAPYKIESVEYKPNVKRFFPELKSGEPYVEGISVKGRLAILYSRFNVGCELHGHVCPSCMGLQSADAYKLAVNAVMYALSH
ncbi:MAG: DUF4159 domain-containing protein [Planctomycetota bacterium]|nr:DUF4159 domain-containing protein [Planctomycetota bacterium]